MEIPWWCEENLSSRHVQSGFFNFAISTRESRPFHCETSGWTSLPSTLLDNLLCFISSGKSFEIQGKSSEFISCIREQMEKVANIMWQKREWFTLNFPQIANKKLSKINFNRKKLFEILDMIERTNRLKIQWPQNCWNTVQRWLWHLSTKLQWNFGFSNDVNLPIASILIDNLHYSHSYETLQIVITLSGFTVLSHVLVIRGFPL